MDISTIDWVGDRVRIIDQTVLPLKFRYIYCTDVLAVRNAIKNLSVRGAPAIGIAGAFGLVLGARSIKEKDFGIFKERLAEIADFLAASRPTAVNLFWALERIKKKVEAASNSGVAKAKDLILQEALRILKEDKAACRRMADFGYRLIKNKGVYLTVCNAGTLATADYGTALGVFYRAKEKAKSLKVFACETRPLLQGARLTSWELKVRGIDVTLIADNTAASLMEKMKIDAAFVGADRIAANADTANKIGTFNLALACHYHSVPFYVVAPTATFDLGLESGQDIPIEHRQGDEVLKLQDKQIAPVGVRAYNPAFDVTPNKFITAIITEKGIIYPPFKSRLAKIIR